MPTVTPSYDYSTGKISITTGTNVVTGTGLGATGWAGAIARRGDVIVLDYGGANEKQVFIVNQIDTNHLEIPNYTGPDLTDVDYIIYWISPTRVAGAEAVEDISRLVNFLNTAGIYVYVDPADTEPDPSLGEEGQSALQPDTGKVWSKTGGAWVFIGQYKGFNPTGEYDAGRAYVVGDVLSLNGSSYIVIAPTAGNAPPNSTYYMINASKGEPGPAILVQDDEPTTDYPENSVWIDKNSADINVFVLTGSPLAWSDTGMTLKGSTGLTAWQLPVNWSTGVDFVVGPPSSVVVEGGETYVCLVDHLSGVFATDLADGKWIKIAAKGTDGTGTGDVIGPSSAVDGNFPAFDVDGKHLKDSGKSPLDFVEPSDLGSAAFESASAFATAAQGGKADTAVQLAGNQTITGGFTLGLLPLAAAPGNFTLDPTKGNYQYYFNSGAFTITAPTAEASAVDLWLYNAAGAGSVTFSGFTVAAGNTGDPLTTTTGHLFIVSIRTYKSASGGPISTYIIKALQ